MRARTHADNYVRSYGDAHTHTSARTGGLALKRIVRTPERGEIEQNINDEKKKNTKRARSIALCVCVLVGGGYLLTGGVRVCGGLIL